MQNDLDDVADSPSTSRRATWKTNQQQQQPAKRLPVTTNGQWNPFAAAAKYLYNKDSGTLKSDEEVQKGLASAFKSKLPCDHRQWLEMASEFHDTNPQMEKMCMGLSWMCVMLNRDIERKLVVDDGETGRSQKSTLTLDTDRLRLQNLTFTLPSGCLVDLNEIIDQNILVATASSSIDITTRRFVKMIVEQLESIDAYMPCYSAPKCGSKVYLPIGDKVIRALSKAVFYGAGVDKYDPSNHGTLTRIMCLTRTSIADRLEKIRRKYNEMNRDKAAAENLCNSLRQRLHSIPHIEADLDTTDIGIDELIDTP